MRRPPLPGGLGGGAGRDLIRAKGGDDTIESPSDEAVSGGNDEIVAGAGFDTVYAVRGSDSIAAGPDVDALVYGGGVPGAVVVDLAARPEWERPEMWTEDGLHPSPLGHRLFAVAAAELISSTTATTVAA